MFEQASRMKLRFNYKGQSSVEDLWDLSVEDLDSIYKVLRGSQKESVEDSLLDTESSTDKVLELQVNIVKHIFTTKQAEKEARKNAAETKMRKMKIAEIIAEKKDEGLKNLPVEELEKILADS